MTHAPDAALTVTLNSLAQRQAMNIIRSRSVAAFGALVGVAQLDRAWITDVQDGPLKRADVSYGELDVGSSDDLQHWYDGYRAGLQFARLNHLGWWWHCEEAPPWEVSDVLQQSELNRLQTQPERYSIPSERSGPPSFLLLLTWLHEDELRCRVLEIEPATQQARDLSVLL
ncbi:hypothetical protein [Deinococcus marmoris]|uniref:Uncharacterized protein n=1 Tax=Deinococcus marmoris TaxID=249408 RepID=A0A1U7NUX8_9DEIO|nr:hypothetical protein [Deinococcus marmoris]OLV16733.1 hypothetical protein BOO71_0010945 [Deinococcus marmoris]